MTRMLSVTEIYRADTEEEVKELIQEFKKEDGYILKSYSSSVKEKKKKGEIEDSGFCVKATKEFGTFWEE